jgi:hypothetical protein
MSDSESASDAGPSLAGLTPYTPSTHYIELLGLQHYKGPIRNKTEFHAEVVQDLYRSTQILVDSMASKLTQMQIKNSFPVTAFLQDGVVELLNEQGSSVWGKNRDHLLNTTTTILYPKDLYIKSKADAGR